MSNQYKIFKGNTGPVFNATPVPQADVTTGGWTARITVANKAGDTPIIDRAVTDTTGDTFSFIAYLTPAETLSLGVGNFLQTVFVTNDTIVPDFNIEKQITLTIEESGA